MARQRSVIILAVFVGALGGALSLARLLITNPDALTTLLWAEDGLFPLCVLKESALICALDPFAGYLLLGPRISAAIAALFPMADWPLVTNLLAAGVAGLAVGVAFGSIKLAGHNWATALLGSLLIVLAPIVGLEAINAVGSIYMPLVFASAVAVALPPRSGTGRVLLAVLLAVTILTIPSAIVLVVGVIAMWWRRYLPMVWSVAYLAILILGMGVQFWGGSLAENSRNTAITTQGLIDWVTALPLALVSFWPGLYFGEAATFGTFVIPPFWPTGVIVTALVIVVGVWALVRGNAALANLLLIGFGLGAIPTLTGYANNRYFVLPALLWALALLLWIDQRWSIRRAWLMPGILVGCLLVWSPAFGASAWRAGATPTWPDELNRIRQVCADPAASVDVRFSPDWPMEITVLEPPTTAQALCVELAGRF